MKAEEFVQVVQSEGVEAVASYLEDELADIDEPRLAAAALGAFWAIAHLNNVVEDMAPVATNEEDEE